MGARQLTQFWHVRDPKKLDALRVMLAENFPRLHALECDGIVLVEGTFELIEDGVSIDSFLVRILLPSAYPIGFPVTWEIGGRVPRILDWHVTSDGSLCVGLHEELWLKFGRRFELKAYLDSALRSYFIGVCEKLAGRPWPWGEWAHGAPALLEFYSKIIGTDDLGRVKELLAVLEKDAVKGHWLCPCGSGKEMRRCHGQAIRDTHQKLPKAMFTRYLKILNQPAAADDGLKVAV
jgi:hypothetical protein